VGRGGSKPTACPAGAIQLGWIKPINAKSGAYTLDTLENNARTACGFGPAASPAPNTSCSRTGRQKVVTPRCRVRGSRYGIDEARSDNTNPLAYKVGLMQADGKRDLELAKNNGDDGDLFPGSSKKTSFNDKTTPSSRAHDGSSTNVSLSGISVANGNVKVRVKQ
jgi:immune inhibitor A